MEDRSRFDVFLKNIIGLGSTDGDRIPSSQIPVKSLYEYLFDVPDNCWKSWKSFVTVRLCLVACAQARTGQRVLA